MTEFSWGLWFGDGHPNTSEAIDNAQALSPLYLTGLTVVCFIIWCVQAKRARAFTGRMSTKRLLVLIGMLVVAYTLLMFSGEGGVAPWIDMGIVIVGSGFLLLLSVFMVVAMPIAGVCAVLIVGYRFLNGDWTTARAEPTETKENSHD